MSYYTEQQVRAAAIRAGGSSTYGSELTLRKQSKPWTTSYDVFLSHAFSDAQLILGVKAILEAMNLAVYVDWIDDNELDRTSVTAATADLLRKRMRQSKSFIFATSKGSVDSRWMPWELGFFDGEVGSEHIAVFPLVPTSTSTFTGQEYLGLYPKIQQLRPTSGQALQTVVTSGLWAPESKSLRGFISGTESFSKTAFR